jgi:nucleoside-diphosphate-sugar epimerase
MDTTRRDFLRGTAATGVGLGLTSRIPLRAATPQRQPVKPLNLLILGGTKFLGPAIVNAALERGHNISLFNRGKSRPGLFPDLEHIIGNRDPKIDPGLEPLKGRKFDAVLDTSSYAPRMAAASAELLKDACAHYLMISTVSVYPDLSKKGLTEGDEVGTIDDPTFEEITGTSYGPLKVLCEEAIEAAMPGRFTSLRPGLIVGPEDSTDRFSYWPLRVRAGGEVLVPGEYGDPVQWIDARDLGEFSIHCIEQKTMGLYNCCGPTNAADMAELVYGCKAVSGGDAEFTWVPAEFCAKQGLQPWGHLPVWAPGAGEVAGINTVDCSKAIAAGMRTRPLADTVRDLYTWWDSQPDERRARVRAGMPREQEQESLAAWHESQKAAGGPATTDGTAGN